MYIHIYIYIYRERERERKREREREREMYGLPFLYELTCFVETRPQSKRQASPRRSCGSRTSPASSSTRCGRPQGLQVRYLFPRMCLCVVFSCLAILRIEGCLNSTLQRYSWNPLRPGEGTPRPAWTSQRGSSLARARPSRRSWARTRRAGTPRRRWRARSST